MSQFGRWLFITYLAVFLLLPLMPVFVHAQNLGTQPATGKAVQGQNADQPEGAFLNLVNWVGNVIAPLGAALCVVMAIVHYFGGRGVARWVVSALALLMVSGLIRLLEFWIQNGRAIN
jgi:ABC-type sulfate transport system permease subunit